MNPSFPWLTVLGAIPLAGSVTVAVLPRGHQRLAKQLAVAFSLAALAVTAVMVAQFRVGGSLGDSVGSAGSRFQFVERHEWIPAFGVSYAVGVDGIGLVLIALAAVLTPVVILGSWHDADPEGRTLAAASPAGSTSGGPGGPGGPGGTAPLDGTRARSVNAYFALILALEAMVIGVFAAVDVFLFYVFFEAMLIPMYFLIGQYGGPQRSYAAVKFLLYSLFGGLLMLAAVIGLYAAGPGGADGFLFERLLGLDIDPGLEKALFLGFFFAFAVKAPLWPFHTWLPDAAAEATPGGAVLLVGVLDKVGTFGMLRYCLPLFPDAAKAFEPVIIVLAVVSIVYGALLAIGQTDMKRLIAYTSVSHFGLIVLGVFAMTTQGQSGSALYMVNHGISTAALFLLAGFLITSGGSRLIADYGGVQHVAPVLAGTFLVAGLSSLALPGLSGFVSEFLVLVGTFTRHRAAAVVAAFAIILAAVYILWLYQRVFTGDMRERSALVRDLGRREVWAIAPLIAIVIALGVYPKPVLDVINPAVGQTLRDVQRADPQPPVNVARLPS